MPTSVLKYLYEVSKNVITLNVVYLHVPGCEVKPRPDLYEVSKNVTTLNFVYLHVPGCEVQPRPDLETTHQAGCFGIWHFLSHQGKHY